MQDIQRRLDQLDAHLVKLNTGSAAPQADGALSPGAGSPLGASPGKLPATPAPPLAPPLASPVRLSAPPPAPPPDRTADSDALRRDNVKMPVRDLKQLDGGPRRTPKLAPLGTGQGAATAARREHARA